MSIRTKLFAASLRHKVIVEKPVKTPDGAGGYITVWETVATLWASIERVRGGEGYSHGQITASTTHIFRLRHQRDITPDMRLSFDGRLFNIRALHNPEEKNYMLVIYAEEGVGG